MAVPRDKWPAAYEPSRFRIDTRAPAAEQHGAIEVTK
jgi:hypothetical protein